MTALPPDVVANLMQENARLQAELRAARDRQTASAEILRTIGGVSGDAKQSLYQIAETTKRLFEASSVSIFVANGDEWGQVIHAGAGSKRIGAEVPVSQLRIGGHSLPGAAFSENRQIHLPDLDNVDPALADWPGLPPARAAGSRTISGTPLRRAGKAIGVLIVHRDRLAPFTAEELALLQTFADQAAIAIENARLFNETKEALERQTATADILKVIASSPSDAQPVFEAIAATTNRLIGGFSTAVLRFVGDELHLAAFTPTNPAADEALKATFPRPLVEAPPFLLVRDGETVQITDTESEDVPGVTRELARLRGFRSMLFTSLMSGGKPIGWIGVTRKEPGSFAAHHVQLVRTFADQAVIAIENARLFNEVQTKTADLTESLQQQTATADVLKVISRSTFDLPTVLNTLVKSAAELCRADKAQILRPTQDEHKFYAAASYGYTTAYNEYIRTLTFAPGREGVVGRVLLERKPVQIADVLADPDYRLLKTQQLGEFRTHLGLPLLREGNPIGILVVSRVTIQPFSDRDIELLTTFADQAVIAIENARLFSETKEALERQTATADILKVIASSPSDVQPVFEAIAATANRLIGGFSTAVLRFIGDGLHLAAFTPTNPVADETLKASFPRPLVEFPPFVLVRDGATVQFTDTESEDVPQLNRDLARLRGYRSMLFTPLMSGGTPIGLISVTRKEPGNFAAHHVQLVRTFADQAVIAIENVRLFDEVQAKTRDLTEALTYQTGSANILKVIASSPTDVGPVLTAIVESACELCEAADALVVLRDGNDLVFKAQHGSIPVVWERQPINRQWASGLAVIDRKPVHVHDLLSTEGEQFPDARGFARRANVRTVLSVPLLREGESIGAIVLRRTEVQPFSDKQIALLQTFADQAVIAIGNVRLFDEVQAKTRDLSEALQQQTATADVLKVISRSAFDLDVVLNSLTKSAVELCNSTYGAISLYRDGVLVFMAQTGCTPEFAELLWSHPAQLDRKSVTGRTGLLRTVVQVPDVTQDEDYDYHGGEIVGNYRSATGVPLLRNGELEGVFTLMRREPGNFTPRQVELVQTFADQAVIAIENVRLFDEVQARTKELAASLEELRSAQDRLVQTEKLASLGQLTAGIAHEIKNPLNFVNNFSALSAELTDELNDVLKSASLADKIREEVDELTGLLKDNLQKVVQHGRRADSIVKNMLLHSREGSGEHRPADINALLDESLNLAYHGARAEKPQFNVTLQRDFDEMAGMIELFPQEITRVFLNLIANGFYAVTKRKTENGGSGFEPALVATTRNLGDTVEICIRDNGTGIPAEVKEKMFNPFFTTKPAGEGTGLGLSMSHDIIVKQHGGTIDVATEPGQFTEFRIVLPRTSNPANKSKS